MGPQEESTAKLHPHRFVFWGNLQEISTKQTAKGAVAAGLACECLCQSQRLSWSQPPQRQAQLSGCQPLRNPAGLVLFCLCPGAQGPRVT